MTLLSTEEIEAIKHNAKLLGTASEETVARLLSHIDALTAANQEQSALIDTACKMAIKSDDKVKQLSAQIEEARKLLKSFFNEGELLGFPITDHKLKHLLATLERKGEV